MASPLIIIEDRSKIFGKSKKDKDDSNQKSVMSKFSVANKSSVNEGADEQGKKGGKCYIKTLYYVYRAVRFFYTSFYFYYFPLVIIIIPFAETMVEVK